MLVYFQMIETDEDKTKFTRLYETYKNLMFSVAYSILNHNSDAEDAVHQAFISVIKHLGKFKKINSDSTKSLLIVITERKAIDIIRKNKRYVLMDDLDNIPGIEIPPPGDLGLADAIAKLPGRYREIILLRYDQGYSTKEIAKILNLTPDTAQKTLWRAKQLLYQTMRSGGAI